MKIMEKETFIIIGNLILQESFFALDDRTPTMIETMIELAFLISKVGKESSNVSLESLRSGMAAIDGSKKEKTPR